MFFSVPHRRVFRFVYQLQVDMFQGGFTRISVQQIGKIIRQKRLSRDAKYFTSGSPSSISESFEKCSPAAGSQTAEPGLDWVWNV